MDVSTALDGFSDFRNRIRTPALAAIADHWNEARAGRRMPSWSDLKPSMISAHLNRIWAFKYDRASREFTARLAGTRTMIGFGASFRGTPLRELHPPHLYDGIHACMTRIVLAPAFCRCTGKLFQVGGRVAEGERIGLPLASDGEHGDGTIGASAYDLPVLGHEGPVELLMDVVEWFDL